MYRTRPNDDEDTIVLACEDAGSGVSRCGDGAFCRGGGDDLLPQQGRLDERVVLGRVSRMVV